MAMSPLREAREGGTLQALSSAAAAEAAEAAEEAAAASDDGRVFAEASWLHCLRTRGLLSGGRLCRLVVAGLVLWSGISLQGCLPPDWSFCDCDFRDNFWNSVLSDVHMVWDSPGLPDKARDNRTWHGRYLQNLPKGYDCPMFADTFWKGWPRFGLTRALIEGSLGDLWMPAARDRFKQICIAGHMSLITICAHHFLVKTARAIEADDPDYMTWMEAAYSHMLAVRNLGQEFRLRQCMRQQGWSIDAWQLTKWSEKWIGKEANGATPMAAYMGGKLDPYQMMFDQPMAHTEATRKEALPDRRPCVPYKDHRCWKRMSKLLIETCEHCCSPFAHKGGRGDPACFDSVYTYERCCQTDFQDLICTQKRKGEEGGCVDCQKTVYYTCLTPPEKRLHDAQEDYNKQVDTFNTLQNKSAKLASDINAAKFDLQNKSDIYNEHYRDYDTKLRVWSIAFNNETRLLASGRFNAQQGVYNHTNQELKLAQSNLKTAREELSAALKTLQGAQDLRKRAEETVRRNESADEAARTRLATVRDNLSRAKEARRSAEVLVAQASADLAAAAAEAEPVRQRLAAAERQRDAVLAETWKSFEEALASEALSESAAHVAKVNDDFALSAKSNASAANITATRDLDTAVVNLTKREAEEQFASQTEAKSIAALAAAEATLQQAREDVQVMRKNSEIVNSSLLAAVTSKEALRCLMDRTPANLTARPNARALRSIASGPVGGCSSSGDNNAEGAQGAGEKLVDSQDLEDQSEFCSAWAKEGQCEENADFMREMCARSCGGRSRAPAKSCSSTSSEGLDLATVAAHMVTIAASIPRGVSLALPKGLVDQVPESFRRMVARAAAALQEAHERRSAADRALSASKASKKSAEQALEGAEASEAAASEQKKLAQADLAAKFAARQTWTKWVESNKTAVAKANETLANRKHDERRYRAAEEEAIALEDTLRQARSNAEGLASKKQVAVTRAKRRFQISEEHLRTLNESMNENVTTAVTAWLESKDPQQTQEQASSWGSRFLKAAKDALVSLVGNLESFLERYVMSLTDRDSAAELVRAVEEHKSAGLHLQQAEQISAEAAAQVRDAMQSEKKAEAARKASEEATRKAAEATLEAEAVLLRADKALTEANTSLAEATRQWQTSHTIFVQREKELEEAKAKLENAKEVLTLRQAELKASEDELAQSIENIEQAVENQLEAHGALEAAADGAAQMYLAELRDACSVQESDFEFYMEQSNLISLTHGLVAQRAEALRLAETGFSNATSEKDAAIKAHEAARAAREKAEENLATKAEELVAASDLLLQRCEEQNATAQTLLEAKAKHALATAARDEISSRRDGATIEVAQVRKSLDQAEAKVSTATVALSMRRAKLQDAFNEVNVTTASMLDAEEVQRRAEAALEEAKEWLEQYVPTLLLPQKEEKLNQANLTEQHRYRAEVNASKWDVRMKKLLTTHERRLFALNAELELDDKNKLRDKAKTLFEQWEKKTVEANTLLEKLIKEETECHEGIFKAHSEVQRLLTEHAEAKTAYENQDPVERNRSFSTYLER